MHLADVEELKAKLEKYGIKSADLARGARISKSVVSKILNGKYNPSYSTVEALFGALDTILNEKPTKARDLMKEPVTVPDYAPLRDIVRILDLKGYSQVPVTRNGKFLGVVTERSILTRSRTAMVARDVLGEDYSVLSPDEPVDKARRLLRDCQAVVLVEAGECVGIVTKTDVIRP